MWFFVGFRIRLKFVWIQVFGTICRIIVLSTGQLETVPVTLGTHILHVSGHCWKVLSGSEVEGHREICVGWTNGAACLTSRTNVLSVDDWPMSSPSISHAFVWLKIAATSNLLNLALPDIVEFWQAGVLWASWLKPKTTGGTGGFKWQCSANCNLF